MMLERLDSLEDRESTFEDDSKRLSPLLSRGSLWHPPKVSPRKERHKRDAFFFMINKFSLRQQKGKAK
jgi:hypothetical protein